MDKKSLDDLSFESVDFPYDVSSLFTEVPLYIMFDYIEEQIYTEHKLPKLSSKLLFKRLLINVTKSTVFSFNGNLYKQINGCGMGNPLSPIHVNIFMSKPKTDVVRPYNPPFYDRYVDDCFSKKKTEAPDERFKQLNDYHPSIKFTVHVEESPASFLDTAFDTRMMLDLNVVLKSAHTGNLKSQQSGKEIASYEICTKLNEFPQISTRKYKILRRNNTVKPATQIAL